MFDSIAGKFQEIFSNIRGMGRMGDKNVSRALREVRLALLEADVNYQVVKEIVEATREEARGDKVLKSIKPGQQFIKLFYDKMVEFMTDPNPGLHLTGTPAVVLLAGLQGSGKTTTAAKLARWLKKQGRSPLLVAADLRRPAAARQLQTLGEKIQVTTFTSPGNCPLTIGRNAIDYAQHHDLNTVILDTSGRLHVDGELMAELKELKKSLHPDELLLTLDAMTGQDALTVAREFDREVGIDGAILTKLDGDARGGGAISFRSVCGKPIKLIGVGEGIDDLRGFDPERLVSRILGMGDVVSLVEKAEEAFDEDQARQWEKKLRRASFDLEDFREQMRQFSKIGSWSALMEMMPRSLPRPAGGEERLRRMGAILDSMTPGERHQPAIIGGSRRERIARGSGTSVPEVNRLLKEFSMTKKMLGKTGKIRNKKIKLGGVNWPL